LSGALRAVAKRFEQIADKIDIDEPREMTSISPDACLLNGTTLVGIAGVAVCLTVSGSMVPAGYP
jgi:hypothetical protein